MTISLEYVKKWLRVDIDDDDSIIEALTAAAISYLKNATGKEFADNNELAKLLCLVLIADWYDNRILTAEKVGEKVRFIVQSMITQLQYSEGVDEDEHRC